jgi:hypothetical protein
MPAGISQRYGVAENRLLDEWAQRSANHYLYWPPQQMFEIRNKTAWKPGRRLSCHIYKKVYVALACFFPTSYGAKKDYVPSAVACRNAKDFLAEVLDFLQSAHSFTLYRQSSEAVISLRQEC